VTRAGAGWRRAVARQRARRLVEGGDAGITMVEVMVSMVLMSIVLAIFTTAIVQMVHSASRNQRLSRAQSQLNIAFLRLDKEIRYAAAISQQGTVGGDPTVEYLTTNTGSSVCTELRLHAGQLQWRTWTQPAPPTVPGPGNVYPTRWLPLASDLSSAAPFTFRDADSTLNFQRLELNLTAGTTDGGSSTSRRTDVTFTALNTSLTSQGDTTECTEGRAIP
jgi:Tfp pilus assembly protein PilV